MFYQKINKYQKQFYIFLLFALSLLVSLINLGIKKDYFGDDIGMSYFFPKILSELTTSTWDALIAPGKINVTSLIGVVWFYPLYWLTLLTINGLVLGRLLMMGFFFLSGCGMFLLSEYLIKNYLSKIHQSLIYPCCFVAGLFFMFNQYSLQLILLPIMQYHLTYKLFPWIFLCFVLNLEKEFSLKKTVIFTLLLLIFFAGNPSNSLSVMLFLITYLMFFFKRFRIKTIIFFIFMSALMFLLLSCYIWLPLIGLNSNPYGFSKIFNNFLNSFIYNSTYTSINNIIRLYGSITFPNLAYYSIFTTNPFLILLGYIIPLIFIFLLMLLTRLKIITFFAIISIISIFLAKGTNPPFPQGLIYLFTHLPFFEMYRSIYLKFNYFLAFCYSLILAQFLAIYFNKKSFRIFYISIIALSALIIVNSYPFFTGEAVRKTYLTKLPQEYLSLKNYVGGLEEGKVISLPPTPQGGGPLLDWGNGNKYIGPFQDYLFFDKPVFDSYWFIKNKYLNTNLNDSWEGVRFENQINNLINKFGAFNIRYIFLHKDLDNGLYYEKSLVKKIDNQLKTSTSIDQLLKNKNVNLLKETKFYNLYKINDKLYLPQFYISNQVIASNNPIKKLLNDRNIVVNNQSKITVVHSNIKNIGNLTNNSEVKITTNKNNPNFYKLKIEKVRNNFLLVFSESYNNNWHIKNLKQNNKNHFIVNGYANGWLLNAESLCTISSNCIKYTDGSYGFELEVEFWPQRLFYIGLFISGTTLLVCISYLVFNSLKKKAKIKLRN